MKSLFINHQERWDNHMATPTIKDMEAVLREFKGLMYDGVKGVMRIDGPKPGPILGITACTHGNEPAGLAIFHNLLNKLNIKKSLQRGTVYLVVNNIVAAEAFFAATTEDEMIAARFKEVNMNRLPDNTLTAYENLSYEVVRARELYPIWERFTIGLDIHSTLLNTSPMIVSRGNNFDRIAHLVSGFPIDVLISNIDDIQINTPVFAFYGGIDNTDVTVFAIEAGQHTQPDSLARAMDCSIALLQNLKMLSGTSEPRTMEYHEYEIADSILFPDKSFDFVQDFKSFCKISQGDLLAINPDGEEVRAPFDGHLVLPTPQRGEKKVISDEVSFISRPVKIRLVR